MRPSFIRLVLGSVLACWALGFAVIVAYGFRQTWSEAEARADGVFYVSNIVQGEALSSRAAKLRDLQPNFNVSFTLLTLEDVAERIGRRPRPGETIHHAVSFREEWYYAVFADGQGALAAGPVHPAVPRGAFPIGAILAVILLPFIGGFIALRVERELTNVERVSEAIGTGEFSARVDDAHGPSAELAATFNTMAERLENLIRSRDELVQAVSHELGSPLSRLRFHLELLENESEEARVVRRASMERELDALDELVAELLSYVQSDDLPLHCTGFDPEAGLADLAELARLDIPEGRSVDVAVSLLSRVSVFADRRLFQRAVENLLRNSVQHARGKVLLEVTEDDAHVTVAVHDDGPGVPPELRQKVLTPFFRLEADRSRATGGVGLGLAIVSRIMRRHGGRLEIASSPLGGAQVATIWQRLPPAG